MSPRKGPKKTAPEYEPMGELGCDTCSGTHMVYRKVDSGILIRLGECPPKPQPLPEPPRRRFDD